MPSYPPRNNPAKKEEELFKNKIRLLLAVQNSAPNEQIIKLIDKFSKAQLSLLKAKTHLLKEKEIQGEAIADSLEQLQVEIDEWLQKNNANILKELLTKK